MPSATATPQPRGVFRNLNVKIYFSWEIGIKSGGKRVRPKAVRFSPDSSLRAAPRAIPSLQKSSPFVPHGLHSLFAGFRTIHPAVVFFCHTFCNPRTFGTLLFLVPQKNQLANQPTRQKRRLHSNRHHRAALAPEKKQLKAIIHNM